jgi:lysophospholipase L1-like esterase
MDYFSKYYTIDRAFVVHQVGDSISAGLGVSQSYPDQELDQMQINGYYASFNNQAVSGRTSANCLTGFPTEIVAKIAPSVKNIVQIMVGHNDLATSTAPSTIYANIAGMIADAHAVGPNVKVLLMTPLVSTNETGNSTMMSAWTSLRNLIITNTAGADMVVDMQDLTSMTNPSDTTRYQDGVHPTILGAGEIATFITSKAESLFATF